MTRAIVAQITHAISHNVASSALHDSELLTIRQALADALATVDDSLRWRQQMRSESRPQEEGMFE
jgi:hypothetical protein